MSSLFDQITQQLSGSALDAIGGRLGADRATSERAVPAALGTQGPGEGILRHVLGGRRASVEAGLGRATGLDAGSVGQLLAMLAPIVMGALGRERRRRGFDAGALAAMLGGERKTVERRAPVDLGAIRGLLDQDGDGQIADDVAKLGGGLLESFLGRR